jgi:hypothetical protein
MGGQKSSFRATAAIFAATNPHVGEASVRAAINLNVNDPSMPITAATSTPITSTSCISGSKRAPPLQTDRWKK